MSDSARKTCGIKHYLRTMMNGCKRVVTLVRLWQEVPGSFWDFMLAGYIVRNSGSVATHSCRPPEMASSTLYFMSSFCFFPLNSILFATMRVKYTIHLTRRSNFNILARFPITPVLRYLQYNTTY